MPLPPTPGPVPPAGMRPQSLSSSRPEWTILTGHFRVGPAYAVWRKVGIPEHIFLWTISGSGFVSDAEGIWTPCEEGRLVLLASGFAHYYATHPSVRRWDFYWCHFWPRAEDIPLLRPPERESPAWGSFPVGDRALRRGITDAMRRMHTLRFSLLRGREELAFNALREATLLAREAVSPSASLDPRVARAVQLLSTEISRPFDLRALARRCGLSVSRLSHLFREAMGCGPQAFAERKKLEMAASWLVAGGRTISEIAESVGYQSPFYFSRRFKASHGMSPSEYVARRKSRKPETPPSFRP